MERILSYAREKGASYAEAITIKKKRTAIEMSNAKTKEISSGSSVMTAARVLIDGKWGVAASYRSNPQSLVRKAVANSKALDVSIDIPRMPPEKAKLKTETKIDPRTISLEEKRNELLSLDKLRDNYRKISTLFLLYGDSKVEYHFMNTEGRDIQTDTTTVSCITRAYSKEKGVMENFWKILRHQGGYELMKQAEEVTNESMLKATNLLKAKHAKGGKFPVIADNKLTGVFAHEAIGHACEADLVLNDSSILQGKVGKQIGNPIISIYDDGQIKQWGYTPYDDEGVKAKRTWLIKKGILKGFLHNRETAAIFNTSPTGNGRSQAPNHKVIPRMTNTIVGKGDSSFEEMIENIKEGYYLIDSAGGQVNPASGEFLFNAAEGYYVKNGEIKHMVKGVSLIGNVLETLFKINMLSKEIKYGKGFCGKSGQHVPVTEGGPHMLINDALVGGQQ